MSVSLTRQDMSAK